MKCKRHLCLNHATCSIVVKIPANGRAIDYDEPMTVTLPIEVCDRHFEEAEPSHFVGMLDCVNDMAKKLGREEPDLTRMWLERGPLDDPEYQELIARNEASNDPVRH